MIRALVAALAGAVRSDSDRAVLQRRLGMQGGAPETLRQIGDDLSLSRERVRQRQERAIGQMRSAAVLPGHRSARDQARDRLTALVTGEDGTPDGGLVRAVAALGLPQADRALAARVIAGTAGVAIFAALSPSSQPASPESMTCTLGYAVIRLPRVVPHAGCSPDQRTRHPTSHPSTSHAARCLHYVEGVSTDREGPAWPATVP